MEGMQTFASLKFFNFRLWLAGGLVSKIGTWMQRVAQDWLVLTALTHDSGTAVGIVTGLQFLPFLLLSPYAGVIVDRFDSRKLLMVTQGVAGALGIGLGTLVLTDTVALWHVYVFAFALGVVSAFDNPARQTFVTQLVEAPNLPNAVGLNSASFNAARLIGPGIAGVLIAAVGTGWVFMINGLTFAATIIALLAMRIRELIPHERVARRKGQVREGVRYVRRRADIVVIMIIVAVVSALGLNFQMTSALMARVEFDKGAGEYGILGSIMAIGSLAGALLAARRGRPRLRYIVGAAALFGVSTGLMALAPTYGVYALLTIPAGFFAITLLTTCNAWVQTTTAPTMRGRVMSLYMMVLMGATPIGSPVVGWIGEAIGPRWAIAVGAISAIVVALAAAWWSKRYWNLELSYAMHRPFVRVAYGRTTSEAYAAQREDAKLKISEQQAENARGQG
jgi:MFS family permease